MVYLRKKRASLLLKQWKSLKGRCTLKNLTLLVSILDKERKLTSLTKIILTLLCDASKGFIKKPQNIQLHKTF